MTFIRRLLVALLYVGLAGTASAQSVRVVTSCGTLATPFDVGFSPNVLLIDVNGKLCVAATPVAITTATQSSVAGSATSVTLLAANTARKSGSTITNDSTAILYISLNGAASTTNYWLAIDGKTTVPGVASLPNGFTGVVLGIWGSATGSARVTEMQ